MPHSRQAVKKAIAQCRTCCRYQGPAFRMPRSPDLPPERVARSPPFTYTAVDYYGPLYCTDWPGKVWVALYTCLAIRAVHLEVATDLSAEQFLLTLDFGVLSPAKGLPSRYSPTTHHNFKLLIKCGSICGQQPSTRPVCSRTCLTEASPGDLFRPRHR